MKVPQENSAQNELDSLLFEYLEGKLPDAQRLELEAKLSQELDLQVEWDCWMESVVEQDFYPSKQLESILMEIPAKPWYATFYFNVFLGVLMVGMFSFLPLSKKEEAAIAAIKWVALSDEVQTIADQEGLLAAEEAIPFAPEKIISSEKIMEKLMVKPAPEVPTEAESFPLHNFSAIRRLAPESSKALSAALIPETGLKKVRVTKARTPSVSRGEARKLAKMKDKAIRERMAREFRKGRRAYVVPLNTKNF